MLGLETRGREREASVQWDLGPSEPLSWLLGCSLGAVRLSPRRQEVK